jgi:hypothetical protein
LRRPHQPSRLPQFPRQAGSHGNPATSRRGPTGPGSSARTRAERHNARWRAVERQAQAGCVCDD